MDSSILEKDEKVEKEPVTTGEAPASNAVWKRKDEPAPAAPAAAQRAGQGGGVRRIGRTNPTPLSI